MLVERYDNRPQTELPLFRCPSTRTAMPAVLPGEAAGAGGKQVPRVVHDLSVDL